jgi:fatty-acyl-CoA synthase
VLKLTSRLKNRYGIGANDRVAVLALNEVDTIVLFFAVQRLGAMLVPVNYRLSVRELTHILADASPALFIWQRAFEASALESAKMSNIEAAVPYDGNDALFSKLEQEPLHHDAPAGSFGSPCMILYTSGTTGKPKGALITNGMLFWNSINTGLRLNLTQQDVVLTFAPFFHTGGWNVLTTPVLHRGGKVILLKKFDADRVLQLCDEAGVTILFGVPTMMDMMRRAASFEKAKLSTVRYAIVGGEPMPKPLIETWHAKGIPVRQGYGLTEFGPNVFSLNEADAIRKIGSVGFANFYIETRVVRDDGTEAGTDEIGELALRGPVCTPGYWNNKEATEQTIRDGWLYTGDLVRKDAGGYFYIVDRKKDMFISGAENVYPAEIEHFLRTHPAVYEVAVIGVPDAVWGESGRAFLVLKPGAVLDEAAVFAFCQGNLAKYKIPKSVRFLPELPKSDSGKILKRALKELP